MYPDSEHTLDALGLTLGYGVLDLPSIEEKSVLCLSIGIKDSPPAPWNIVLLIEPTGNLTGEYRRTGAAFIRPKDYFDACEYQMITLI